ncbi:MAG: hypothetical protein F4X98_14835 [Gammaproteobacteria bacterium]|nr:hypothetical protein [Gammaproteobacteria bacterium]
MARKSFLLRTDPEVLAAVHRWAADELRSVNAQIDFLVRTALRQAGRLPSSPPDASASTQDDLAGAAEDDS